MTGASLFVILLLLLGVIARLRVRLFRWLYIPASVIAGLAGLFIVQSVNSLHQRLNSGEDPVRDRTEMPVQTELPFQAAMATQEEIAVDPSWLALLDRNLQSWTEVLADWPGFLIAVVFAGMLLERKPVPWRDSVSQVGRQGLMVWIIVVGQTALGLTATWLLIQPLFDLPNSFGMLIETGFAGGHGTAAAMGKVYSNEIIGLDGGLDLGILMATCGLVYGVVSGIVWINLAIRWGWIAPPDHGSPLDQITTPLETPIGHAKVGSETIDPLLLQVIWLSLAVGIGIALQAGVAIAAEAIDVALAAESAGSDDRKLLADKLSASTVLAFPLFIYTLFGGWIVRRVLRTAGQEEAVDRDTINRLTSTSMDLLVVAAITSLDLTAVASLLLPFSILLVTGILWSGICLLVLSRWILPPAYWFQLGLINYGMSTGTTATGFVLLRVVDPELESGAAEDYALAAPLSSPFIGGGMLTVALPLLLLEVVPIGISASVAVVLVATMIYFGIRWNRPFRFQSTAGGDDAQSS